MFRVGLAGTALTLAGILPFAAQVHSLELITAEEARLPDHQNTSKGISRGPKIVVVNPAPTAGFIRSPFTLKIRFESFGGAKIDADSILLTYKKNPPIDLTQ